MRDERKGSWDQEKIPFLRGSTPWQTLPPLPPNARDVHRSELVFKLMARRDVTKDVVFVGDRGMVKSTGKKDLDAAGFRYISALTDPQIRRLLSEKIIQMELFTEQVCEVEADTRRFICARIRRKPGDCSIGWTIS